MSKNIIFCADGTWNGPGNDDNGDSIPDRTNVLRLFSELDGTADAPDMFLRDEQEKVATTKSGVVYQVSKYLHGVGDSNNWLEKIMGGVFGAGMVERIVRGYTFISRNYAKGDKIYLVGFSRGAYTVRALAGMIGKCGLLDATQYDLSNDKEEAYRLGTAVWRSYREHSNVNGDLLDRIIRDAPYFLHDKIDPNKMLYFVPIEAVAVWETVGALGIPKYWNDERVDVYRFTDTSLGEHVKYGRQALAIDEMRRDFTPTYWDQRKDIIQVLFPGIHADVGGGYSSVNNGNGLSNGAYLWMRDELVNLGVKLQADNWVADFCGQIHCEWYKIKYSLSVRKFKRPASADLAIHHSAISRVNYPNPLPVQDSKGQWGMQIYRPASLVSFFDSQWKPGVDIFIV
ncbi:DUF2235 domain-containing protein [Buttiauxella selenatireducens]|uniref:DUF2235 domain-containing protein n=1 Tax=Buttiauxella selenatireducens TaxID=3073902 RepID=A0ABY9SG37_9ENTR|nr:DUF2235 domain-containing protein [Buttiauxella sp. R73]WMY76472.1 DUF2235 domain-containing protein [Buttiauxella sp. R73]